MLREAPFARRLGRLRRPNTLSEGKCRLGRFRLGVPAAGFPKRLPGGDLAIPGLIRVLRSRCRSIPLRPRRDLLAGSPCLLRAGLSVCLRSEVRPGFHEPWSLLRPPALFLCRSRRLGCMIISHRRLVVVSSTFTISRFWKPTTDCSRRDR